MKVTKEEVELLIEGLEGSRVHLFDKMEEERKKGEKGLTATVNQYVAVVRLQDKLEKWVRGRK